MIIRVRVGVRVRVRVRVRGGLLPTTSHSIFYRRVGQIAILVIVNHKTGRILNEISLPPNPPILVTMHGETDLSGFS